MTYQLEYKRDGSGFYEVGYAGETLGARKLVYRNNSGVWMLADSDDAAKMPSIGLTLGAISSGKQGKIITKGYVGDSSWSWTIGLPIFATGDAGELSQTAPTTGNQQVIGYAAEDDLIFFTPRQTRGTGSPTTYMKYLSIPTEVLGKPNTNPPAIVDQDNVTLLSFTVNSDNVTVKTPIPTDYVSGSISFALYWTNDGGTDDNGKTVKVSMSYQTTATGGSIAGNHANSPKTVQDTYVSASGWIEHITDYIEIPASDFTGKDCIFAKFTFVTPTGTALTSEPHLIGICMRYLATPDR